MCGCHRIFLSFSFKSINYITARMNATTEFEYKEETNEEMARRLTKIKCYSLSCVVHIHI